jgi:hypothetical protein
MAANGGAKDPDLPARKRRPGGHAPHECGFAGAIAPDEDDDLARAKTQRHIFQCEKGAVPME